MRKERKIFDCFFYHNEEEILDLRLHLHGQHVDYFVIVEFSQSFDFQDKKTHLNLEDTKFTKFIDKIIHIKIPKIDTSEIKRVFKLNKHYELEKQFQLNKKNIFFFYGSYMLSEMITNKKPKINDLIFVSDIDEIIDFDELEQIKDNLKYGTVFLQQKNFIWSDKFFLKDNYEGTFVIEFSQILRNKKTIPIALLLKNEKNFTKNIVKSGWHLSHFYDIDETFVKLNLIYPDLKLSRENILKSFRKLENPIPNNFQIHENLSENDIPIPFSITNLSVQPLGRPLKQILITWEQNNFVDNFYDGIIDLNYVSEDLPKYVLYGNEKYENFQKIFLINESNKKLEKLNLLKEDLITFNCDELIKKLNLYFGTSKTISFPWKKVKECILYDLLLENSISPD